MTVTPLQNQPVLIRGAAAALQPARSGFLNLLTRSGAETADAGSATESEAPDMLAPDVLAALTEELSDLRATVTAEITGMPELSPAGLERFEEALSDTITDRLAAFDARHGTSTLQAFANGPRDSLAMAAIAPATADGTALDSLDAAISRVAATFGIDLPADAAPAHGPAKDTATSALSVDPQGTRATETPSQPATAPTQSADDRAPVQAAERTLAVDAHRPQLEQSSGTGQPPISLSEPARGASTPAVFAAADRPVFTPLSSAPGAPPIPAEPAVAPGVMVTPASTLAPSSTSVSAPLPPATAPVPPVEPPLLDQVRRTGITAGRTRIELAPEGLGALEIDLSADEAGQLRVVVRAENAAVLSMLRQDRAGLAMALGDSGVSLGDAGLDFESFAEPRRDRGAQDESAPSTPASSDAPDAPGGAVEPARHPYRPRAAPGRLDILT